MSVLLTTAIIVVATCISLAVVITMLRLRARNRREYVRLRIAPYRGDEATAQAIVNMFEALHKRLLRRWWRRLVLGQPSVALEVHFEREAWFAVSCPVEEREIVQAALRSAYPNCRLQPSRRAIGVPPQIVRCKKHAVFTKRVKQIDRFEHDRAPAMNRLLTTMAACDAPAFVQLSLTPVPSLFEGHSKRLYKRHENRLSRERKLKLPPLDRSMVEDAELKGGLNVQHRPLFFTDVRVIGQERRTCERIASELRAEGAENRLVERGTVVRHALLGIYTRRVQRGEGNPIPSTRKGVLASTELAALWHLPSMDYTTVPLSREPLPLAPAPPAILRPAQGTGTLRDAYGPVSIHEAMRRQNTAVPGTVEQGKSSYLVATVAEDLRRERCAVIVLDPKGDAAEAAVSLVPKQRTCTLLDFSRPTCGFNPLAVDAPADTIADYVVQALKNLFTDADIRASSDRYLRNAIIAVLAYDRSSTLWDAARLLSVGEEGYAFRARVASRVRTQPEFKEIAEFFAAELSAQLADSRSTTTAKLDAPVNKLARLLNSPSIKRVLLNDSLRISFDDVIANGEILVVKGALGSMGAGNTSVLMQLLVGMLDAALARRQDTVSAEQRNAVALKVDEAPLVLNRGFAETMALKRSAGLETVACWQTDSQWVDREVRDQLDALFAHRVYFATASVEDARNAARLTMAEFSDTVRPGIRNLSALGRPDVRLHLPKHNAIASWVTSRGRQPPFVAQTLPLRVDKARLAFHAARQAERGGRYLDDLSQPHWDRPRDERARPNSLGAASAPSTSTQTPPRSRPQPATPAATSAAPSESPPTQPAVTSPQPSGSRNATSVSSPERPASEAQASKASPQRPAPQAQKPASPPDSYRELVDLSCAHSVRWAKPPVSPKAIEPEPIDIEILALVASMRHVLSSQIHRRFNGGRAATTTQRRLKRLSDAELLMRFQFHRRDGGGVPMCYTISPSGRALLDERGQRPASRNGSEAAGPPDRSATAGMVTVDVAAAVRQGSAGGARVLAQAHHDVRVTGYVLALERSLAGGPFTLRGPEESVLSPPTRSTQNGHASLTLAELRLPAGRTPHDFLRSDATGGRLEVERFETIRPDATLTPEGHRRELMIELDDRLPEGAGAAKLERYDHFLAGWSAHVKRYARHGAQLPLVVFVCRDRARARECARKADRVLVACRAYPGEYPADWQYPSRERVLFAAERDAHEGIPVAYGVSPLPPEVRVTISDGDPRAREPIVRESEISCASPAEEPALAT